MTRLRLKLARSLFGVPQSSSRKQPSGVRLACRPLEDRLPPGDILWTGLGADLGRDPATPAASAPPELTPSGLRFLPGAETPRPGLELEVARPYSAAVTVEAPRMPSPTKANDWLLGAVGVAPQAGLSLSGPRNAQPVAVPAPDAGVATANPTASLPLAAPAVTPDAPTTRPNPSGFLGGFVGVQPPAPMAAVPVGDAAAPQLPMAAPVAVTAAPAVTPVAAPTGDYYLAGDTAVELSARAGAVAVKFADAATAQAATQSLPDGVRVARWVTKSAALLEGPNAAAVGAALPGGVAVPVFTPKGSGSGRDAVVFDELIVRLDPGVTPEAAFAADPRVASVRHMDGTPDQFIVTTAVGAGSPTLRLGNDLRAQKGVAAAEPNFYQDWQKFFTPNDPLYGNQWHLKNTGQKGGTAGADVNAPQAWDVTPGGSSAVTVAVVDDGIELAHPDLAANIWVNPGETAGDGIDNDGNGYTDDVNGWDFTSANGGDSDPGFSSVNDEHGTAVAGVAAGKGNNGLGTTGIAYQSKIMGVRIFDGPTATSDANIASAIYYAGGRTKDGAGTWKAADIANNSWGGGALTATLQNAFTWAGTNGRGGKGTINFIATGNGSATTISSPAILSGTSPGVIAVGASTDTDVRASYSNTGPQIDFVAPSNGGAFGVVTTDRTGATGYNATDYTAGGEFGGTSSATPLAAGIGALVLARDPNLTAEQVRGVLRNSTDLIGGATYDASSGFNIQYGRGRLNAYTAVKSVGAAGVSVTTATAEVPGGAVSTAPSVGVGQSASSTFRVRNQGTTTLNLAGLTVGGNAAFGVGSGFTATALGIGESATFTVRFAPTASGTLDGTVSFTTNDPNKPTFTFTVRETALPTAAYGRAFEDWNGDGLRSPNDPGLGGRTVYLDTNNNGVFDTGSATNTFTQTASSAIPDLGTVTSNLAVSGLAGPVTDVNVTVNITHTFDRDLVVTLISPAGTRVNLFSAVGGSGENFTNTVLDDEAATAIGAGTAPFTGSFRPAAPLTAYDNLGGNGTWKLEVSDTAAADIGTLDSWGLTIASATGEPYGVTDAGGYYSFATLADGPYTARTATPAGWATTAGGAGRAFTVAGASLSPNLDFGQAKNDRFYGYVFNDANRDGAITAGEPPVAGRTLFRDLNGNGTIDAGSTFTQGSTTVLPIPDNNPTGATSSFTVTGQPGTVLAITVTVNITHTWDADLVGTLIAPDGTRVALMNRNGGSGDNFTSTVFDDAATTAIASGTAPFTGRFRPTGLLSTTFNSTANGLWQLEMVDTVAGDSGTLNSWGITVRNVASEPVAVTDALGDAAFDLPAGTHDVRLAPLTGFVFTSPATGLITVTTNGTPLTNRNFGTAPSLPAVSGTASINGAAAQRSRVTDLGVTFTGTVSAADQSALTYTLTRVRRADGTADGVTAVTTTGATPQVTVTYSAVAGNTVAALKFTGADTDGVKYGSLADGVWQLVVKSGATAVYSSPTVLTTAGSIYRLFADANGDKSVDFLDAVIYKPAFGSSTGSASFVASLDYNADGSIDFLDAVAYKPNFGVTIS